LFHNLCKPIQSNNLVKYISPERQTYPVARPNILCTHDELALHCARSLFGGVVGWQLPGETTHGWRWKREGTADKLTKNERGVDRLRNKFGRRVHKFNSKYVNLCTEAFYFAVNLIESSCKICKCNHNSPRLFDCSVALIITSHNPWRPNFGDNALIW